MNVDEYHKLAAVEDRMWYFRALHRHVERELVRALGERPASVLDAGCGTGGLIRRLASPHPKWIWSGIDVSDVACALARERLGQVSSTGALPSCEVDAPSSRLRGRFAPAERLPANADIRQGSVTELPFADGTFDAVVSADVLYHVDDDQKALREFQRVLRPNGIVVINVPAYQWLWSYHDEAVHSLRRYNRPGVLHKLHAAGFQNATATYWNSIPFPLVVGRRKLLPPPKDGSDVHLFPAPIEAGFDLAMAVERGWLRLFGRLPFGTSVFAVAGKR